MRIPRFGYDGLSIFRAKIGGGFFVVKTGNPEDYPNNQTSIISKWRQYENRI